MNLKLSKIVTLTICFLFANTFAQAEGMKKGEVKKTGVRTQLLLI